MNTYEAKQEERKARYLDSADRARTMSTLTINGYTQHCDCGHCGRPLKHGVQTSERGTIGADCFVKLIEKDKKRYSGNGKPSAEMVKQYAIIVTKGLDYAARCHGLYAHSFRFLAS